MNLILDFWTATQCQAHLSYAGIPAVSPSSALLGVASPRASTQERHHAARTLSPCRILGRFFRRCCSRRPGHAPSCCTGLGGAGLQGPGMPPMPAGSFRDGLVPGLFSQQWDLGLGSSCAGLKPAEILKRLQKEGEKVLSAPQPLLLVPFAGAPTHRPLFPSAWKREDLEMFHFVEWLQSSSFPLKRMQRGPRIFCAEADSFGLCALGMAAPVPGWCGGSCVPAPPPWPNTCVRAAVGERFPPSSDLGASQQKHLLERGQA